MEHDSALGYQWPSTAIKSNQWQSTAIKSNQRASEGQQHSLEGHQKVISAHHAPAW
jgi:hypothetical protein